MAFLMTIVRLAPSTWSRARRSPADCRAISIAIRLLILVGLNVGSISAHAMEGAGGGEANPFSAVN